MKSVCGLGRPECSHHECAQRRISFARTRPAFEWLELAYGADVQGDLNRAEILYRYAIRADECCWRALYNLGILLFHTKRPHGAKRCFEEVVRTRPQHYRAFNMLGFVYYSYGELPKAVWCFRKAKNINPFYAKAWKNFAITLSDMSRDDLAQRAWKYYEMARAPGRLAGITSEATSESTLVSVEAIPGIMNGIARA